MYIRQLSVFIENKTGHLEQILAVLAQQKININALTVADSSDYGLVRMLVSDPEKAMKCLREANFTVRIHEVISLEMDAAPGSMWHIMRMFTNADVSIEYIYAFSFGNKSILVLRTNNTDIALAVMQQNGLKPITERDLKIE